MVSKAALILQESKTSDLFIYLDDFDIRVKSGWQTKMQNPVEPGSEQKHNISLEKSSWPQKCKVEEEVVEQQRRQDGQR